MAVIPTLSRRMEPILTDPADRLAHLVTFMFRNPGNISEHHRGTQPSFRSLRAKHEHAPGVLADAVQAALQDAIDRQFTEEIQYTAMVTYEMMEEAGTYKIIIRVTNNASQPALRCDFNSVDDTVAVNGQPLTFTA